MDKVEQKREQIMAIAEEIRAILAIDIPIYIMREVRSLFIEDVAFSESQSDEAIGILKRELGEFSKAMVLFIEESLKNEDLWLESEESRGKSLEANVGLKFIFGQLSERLSEFVSSKGLSGVVRAYRSPERFIEGKYMPGLIEKYWLLLSEYKVYVSQKKEENVINRKEVQASRWDAN